jgi:hypothetical protein
MADAGPVLGGSSQSVSPVTAHDRRDKSKDMSGTISTSIPNVVHDDSTVRRGPERDKIQLPASNVKQSSITLSVNELHSKTREVV